MVGEGKAGMHKSAVSESGKVMFLKVSLPLDKDHSLPLRQLDALRVDDYLHRHCDLGSTIDTYAPSAYLRNYFIQMLLQC